MNQFLDSLETDNPERCPADLLDNTVFAQEITPTKAVEVPTFKDKRAMVEWLDKDVHISDIPGFDRDRGLWAWLALYLFDQLCPERKDGSRKPGERARWIPELDNAFRYYRHLVAGPFLV